VCGLDVFFKVGDGLDVFVAAEVVLQFFPEGVCEGLSREVF
jgi:hypothetical protein